MAVELSARWRRFAGDPLGAIYKNYVWLMNILLTIKMYSPISMVSVTMQVVFSPALFTADTQH